MVCLNNKQTVKAITQEPAMRTTTGPKTLMIHLLFLLLPALAAAQSNHWFPLIEESKWILHVRVDKVNQPSMFSSNFQISRVLEFTTLDTLYAKQQQTSENQKDDALVSIRYKTAANTTDENDVAVREGFEYSFSLKKWIDTASARWSIISLE